MAKGKVGLGRRGEMLAATVLARHGFTLITRNWYCPKGEADLVATQAGEWYFFEVRTRRGKRYGTPEETITPKKLERMEAVARHYLGEHLSDADVAWHLGLVAVEMDGQGHLLRQTIYPDIHGAPLPSITVPLPNAYWVEPGKLLAGEHPQHISTAIQTLLAAGITCFVDLTEPGELTTYASTLDKSIAYYQLSIPDFDIPSEVQMIHILDTIDTAIATGRVVYVHCWAGVGRTGTVIGCYLARHGTCGQRALLKLEYLRAEAANSQYESPSTKMQRTMVENWEQGK
ncbi:MAG: YraN family protein [Anaerolineae bacterium]|nr:YraN family protein [Anaerolineae bacterium]